MKIHLRLATFLAVLFLFIGACSKNDPVIAPAITPGPLTPVVQYLYPPVVRGKSVYFWGYPRSKTTTGYEMLLNTKNVSQGNIENVSVAVYNEMDIFRKLPTTYKDLPNQDSIKFSYTYSNDTVKVFAETTFDLNFSSDVLILYY